jgi:hypothetical protein
MRKLRLPFGAGNFMSMRNAIECGASSAADYQRGRDLPKLLPLWPHEMVVAGAGDHARLLARMRRALRIERQRGIAGHWAYDLARHAQLLRAYRAETADYLQRIKGGGRASKY